MPKIRLKNPQSFKVKILKHGYTQRALAIKAGTSIASLNALINGKRGIGAGIAKKISIALECDFDDIFLVCGDCESNQVVERG